jgi:hypothetical protein
MPSGAGAGSQSSSSSSSSASSAAGSLLSQRGFVAGSSPSDEVAVPGIVRLALKYVGQSLPLAALDEEDRAVTAEAVKAKAAAEAAAARTATAAAEPLDDEGADADDGEDDEDEEDDLVLPPPCTLPKSPSQQLAVRLAKIAREASAPASPPPSAAKGGKGKKGAAAKPKAKSPPVAVKGRK